MQCRPTSMSSQTFLLSDGRRLGYAVEGEGKPVIYFHGTASSRLEIRLLKQLACQNRFMLIGVDRPGYGLSTFTDRVRLRDFAADVNALADHLGLDRFAVLSWSGGGPFALTYITKNLGRVTHAVAVGSPALPFDPSAAHNNNPLAKFAMKTPYRRQMGTRHVPKIRAQRQPRHRPLLEVPQRQEHAGRLAPTDARFFADPAWLKLMYAAMAEGFRQGGNSINAVYQEHCLFMRPWNEPIEQIPAGKLTLWQGAQDKTCPVVNVYRNRTSHQGRRAWRFSPTKGTASCLPKLKTSPKSSSNDAQTPGIVLVVQLFPRYTTIPNIRSTIKMESSTITLCTEKMAGVSLPSIDGRTDLRAFLLQSPQFLKCATDLSCATGIKEDPVIPTYRKSRAIWWAVPDLNR